MGNNLGEGGGLKISVENLRIYDGKIVDVAVVYIEIVRSAFVERTAKIAVQKDGVIGGLFGVAGKRVAGVESGSIAVDEELAVDPVGAGLGEDFDAAIAQVVVFRGERVLVDANLANGGFRRKLAAGEAVNVDLSPTGTGGGARKGFEIGLKIVGIIGERLEILAFQDDLAGVVALADFDGRGFVGDDHFFGLDLDAERDFELHGMTRGDCDFGFFKRGETLRDGLNGVRARGNLLDFKRAILIRDGGNCRTLRRQNDDCGVANGRTGRIQDLSLERA